MILGILVHIIRISTATPASGRVLLSLGPPAGRGGKGLGADAWASVPRGTILVANDQYFTGPPK